MIKLRLMRWARRAARKVVKKNMCRLFVGMPKPKRPLGGTTCRWVDNIKMDLADMGWGMDWRIVLTQDRDKWRDLVNMTMSCWLP
jgi:hypothetical protein